MDIDGGFGKSVQERKGKINDLRETARRLHHDWVEIFGPHDTPVPIDIGWHHTHCALDNIQTQIAEEHIDLAESRLKEAKYIIRNER